MKINKKQQESRKIISQLDVSIQESINKICEEHSYTVTYAEINTALTRILYSNLGNELKEDWKEDKE